MIIGTAGHIDHGKTTLVRALTGVDTDRLPEEKARGISIDLGYAYTALAGGDVLGFVDVPGHERFIHTMLAGATGIDFALLVVAADDGVMPQTREHVDILALLGIGEGAIALTKTDVVDSSRVAEVSAELRTLTARTPLRDAPIYPVSARTGQGIDALRDHLATRAAEAVRRSDNGHFRLAVDRSFTLTGIGTVVTGTVHSGEVRVGDEMIVAPAGRAVRVRSVHAQNRASELGSSGQRCALNLASIARDEVGRGDWVVAPELALSTTRFDARLTPLRGASRVLDSSASVHLHLGAAHVVARLVALDAQRPDVDESAPEASRLVQVVLRSPIAAWRGDRFIVRDASATQTLAGGRVLDPFAPTRYRRSPERLAVLAALEEPTPGAQLARLLDGAASGVDLARFARAGNLCHLDEAVEGLGARRVAAGGADFLISQARWRALAAQALQALGAFHDAHREEMGPDAARLKRIAFPKLDPAVYRALIADLLAAGELRQSGPWLHLPQHDNAPSPQESTLVARILPRLLGAPFDPPWVRDLAKDLAQPEALVRTALIRASKRGESYQVVRDLFYHPAAIRELAATAASLQDAAGEVRAAEFRDRTGLGRKRAIQILEFFDRVGFTRRVRDGHVVRGDSLLALDAPAAGARDARRPRAAGEHRL